MPARDLPGWLCYPAADGLRDLDVALGQFLLQQAPHASETALRLAVLCSARVALGHPCLDVDAVWRDWVPVLPECWHPEGGGVRPAWLGADLAVCLRALAAASFVGDGSTARPLVLHGHRLYLARYWAAGRRIRVAITQRLQTSTLESQEPDGARQWLDRVFPVAGPALDWQRIACANALLQRFSIVTGGPGTGKTTTVVRLLAVLQGLAQTRGLSRGLTIRLAAPTGKAAARLNESIAGALQASRQAADAPLQAALDRVPAQVVTLHRLLGSRPDTRHFTHHAGHPLELDVLVVDEASMMDVEMMDAVLAALPPEARLILLGDHDQLASVEAGAVLGELCARAAGGHYRPVHCTQLQRFCGQAPGIEWQDARGTDLDQAVVMLRHSYRFDGGSGIGRFAAAVNAGDERQVASLERQSPPGFRVLRVQAGPSGAVSDDWLRDCGALGEAGYPAFFHCLQAPPAVGDAQVDWDQWARAVLRQQGRFQLLCALRAGPWGVEGLNQRIEWRLRQKNLIPSQSGAWYPGRPVLVTRNEPALGLSNGDIGVVLPVPDAHRSGQTRLRVAFAGMTPDAVRWVSPARLASIETVYALTVHKSQGSEFEQVVLVLPDRAGPLLTRELLYTGATRARASLALVVPWVSGRPSPLLQAVRQPTQRARGIWNPDA